jgi:membrane-anchored protein YejM (alkaline phosphatase superfamily)
VAGGKATLADMSGNNAITQAITDGLTQAGRNDNGTDQTPKAYINYMLFNEQFNVVKVGYSRVGNAGVVKDHFSELQNIPVAKNGYLYVYVSNESPVAVFFDNLQVVHFTEWKFQRYMRDYFSAVASLDRNIGRALDYLDRNHLADNTIVIYLSDQGFYLGEHGWFDKRWMYEESFRTPRVMRYPAKIKPGTLNHDFVMNLDIAPTVLDAANVPVPKDMQGESFLPFVTKGKKSRGMRCPIIIM